MNHPEATAAALGILRNPATFQWYIIPLLAVVIYIYANEIQNRRWNVVAAGLALYVVHWLVEIVNALVQHFTGHALWTVPTGTAFLLLIGVGVEISLMFSIAGLALCPCLCSCMFPSLLRRSTPTIGRDGDRFSSLIYWAPSM